MNLDADELLEYDPPGDGRRRGQCRIWLARGRNVAVAVLTELPGDPSGVPLYASMPRAAAAACRRFGLLPSTTLWYHRRISATARGTLREHWTEFELVRGEGGELLTLDVSPSLRSAAEIAAHLAFPEIGDDEHDLD